MIRECSVEDVKLLQKICSETFKETFEEENTEENLNQFLEEAYNLEKLTKELKDINSKTYLVFEDDEVVGYLKLNRGDAQTEDGYENSLEVQRIYILKKCKGKGIGSELMKLSEEEAKKYGLSYIWLGVWEHNTAAIEFYKKNGFKKFSEHVFVLGDDRQTDYLMKKTL